ncbi:MAG: hypothetical protein WKF53_16940, partial [Rubrobacter sp.]
MEPPGATTQDYLTLALAAWGAALSTLLAARQIARDRPAVKVRVLALAVAPNAARTDSGGSYWKVRAINVRARPIEIDQVGLRVRGRSYKAFVPQLRSPLARDKPATVPLTLQDGESATFYFDRDPDTHERI